MSDTINQVNYQAPSFKAESEARAKARKIYSALSKKDSMRIFELAANGIEATTDALANNGFSKKRYYVRLSKLIELGLVEKKAGNRTHTDGKRITYEQTSLGKVIYKEHVLKLEDLIELFLPSEKINKLDPTVASIAEQTRAVAIVGANAH
ncbi:MAG: hypothetical protein JRN52_08220 [Nitrososphaerota archaeon]|nr:hypothetical protein [Nitrososphaerota archaeon]